jgi:hypothetical protein
MGFKDPFILPLLHSARTRVKTLVYKSSRRCLRLQAGRLRSFEIRLVIVASYVGDARPVRYIHRHTKDYADNGSVTAGR